MPDTPEQAAERARPIWMPDLQAIVAMSMLGTFGLVVVMLLFRPMPMTEQAGAVLLTVVGMILGKVGTIVDFYFGSNKGNKDKDATILAQAQAATPAANGAVLPQSHATTQT